jgi:hypothetical protein
MSPYKLLEVPLPQRNLYQLLNIRNGHSYLQSISLILSLSPPDLLWILRNMAFLRSSRANPQLQAAQIPANHPLDSESHPEPHLCSKLRQPRVSPRDRSHRNAPPDISNLWAAFKLTHPLEELLLESPRQRRICQFLRQPWKAHPLAN